MKSAMDTMSPLLLPILLPFLFAISLFQRVHGMTGAFLSYHVVENANPAALKSELRGMFLELITLSPIVSLCVVLNLAARAFHLVLVSSVEASGTPIESAPESNVACTPSKSSDVCADNVVAASSISASATMTGPMSDHEDAEFTASVHSIETPATPESASKFTNSSLFLESGGENPESFTSVESIESDVVTTDFASEDEDEDYEPDSDSDSDAYEYDSNYESDVEDDIVEETTNSVLRLDISSNVSQESDNESENSSLGVATTPATSPEPMSDSELPTKGFTFTPEEEPKKFGLQLNRSFAFTHDEANKVGSQVPTSSLSFASQDEVKKVGLQVPTSSFTFSCDDGPKQSAFQLQPPVATFSFSSKFQDLVKLEAEKKKDKNRKRAELRKAAKNKNVSEVPEPKFVDITPKVTNAILKAFAAPRVVDGSNEVFNEEEIKAEAHGVDIEVVLAELKGRDVEVTESKVKELARVYVDEQKLGAKKAKEQLRKKEQRKKNRAAKKVTKEE
jgi:hypothetical protein